MERKIGTVSRGIRGPIIREGDDLAQIVTDSVLQAAESRQAVLLTVATGAEVGYQEAVGTFTGELCFH